MSLIVDAAGDEIESRIAFRLRERREALQLSLEDLARRSGVSRAMISKVERRQSSPTAALLGRLCNGLGITLSSLMASAERAPMPLLRAGDQPQWRDPLTALLRVAVSPTGTGSSVEIVRIELPRGEAVASEPPRHLGYTQHLLVLEGSLSVTLGERRVALAAGDCLFMRTDEPVRFANEGPRLCRYLVIMSKTV
jgi:transcriptional regulator with XRE-family HTH domain